MKHLALPLLPLLLALSCNRPPLGEAAFARVLIDIHTADGALTDARVAPVSERDKYMYYAGIFRAHGITRAQFDTCIHYYSSNPERYDRVYARVTRVLERRDGDNLRIWNELTRGDTVNLIPFIPVNHRDTLLREYIWYGHTLVDTLHLVAVTRRLARPDTLFLDTLNPRHDILIDSIRPGRYEMHFRVKLDSATRGIPRVRPYFTSTGGDTLRPRDVIIYGDVRPRDYTWGFYVEDSTVNRLHVRLLESDSIPSPTGWITALRCYRRYLPPGEARRAIEQQRAWAPSRPAAGEKGGTPR
jgi:hypothetical protein